MQDLPPGQAKAREGLAVSADATVNERTAANGSVAALLGHAQPVLLHLFSGPTRARGSFTDFANASGYRVIELDTKAAISMDILDTATFDAVLRAVRHGTIRGILCGVPCASFSVLRAHESGRGTLPPIRSRAFPDGLPHVPTQWRNFLAKANKLVRASVTILTAAHESNIPWILENPADRGDTHSHLFRQAYADHAPLWLTSWIVQLQELTQAKTVTFPQCQPLLAGEFQKYTTLMFSADLENSLRKLGETSCNHHTHQRQAVGAAAADAAAYPPRLNLWLAHALQAKQGHTIAQDCLNYQAAGEFLASIHDTHQQTAPSATVSAAVKELPSTWDERTDYLQDSVRDQLSNGLAFLSRRRAEPALPEELRGRPFPQMQPPPSTHRRQPIPQELPAATRAHMAKGNIPIASLFLPGVYDKIQLWISVAQQATQLWQRGIQAKGPPPLVVTQDEMPVWARGIIWETSDPHDCRPVQRSSLQNPVKSDVNAEFFQTWGRKLQWPDQHMIQQAQQGVLADAQLPLTTVLISHHSGARQHTAFVDESIRHDTNAGWITTGTPHLQWVPTRLVPKNVAHQTKWKQRPDGSVEEVTKPRVPQMIPSKQTIKDPTILPCQETSGQKPNFLPSRRWRRL